jgi:hypothetical protein
VLRFLLSLTIAAVVLAFSTIAGVERGWFQLPSFFYETLIFLAFGTIVIFYYLHKAKSSGFFAQLYLLTMALKLLAYCVYNLIIILEDRGSAVQNVVFFMIVYFVFTVLEIMFLYGKIVGEKTPPKPS